MTPPRLIVHVVHSLRVGGLENGVVNVVNVAAPIVCMTTGGALETRLDRAVVVLEVTGCRDGASAMVDDARRWEERWSW